MNETPYIINCYLFCGGAGTLLVSRHHQTDGYSRRGEAERNSVHVTPS
jgi:hypothetical protein